MGEANFLGSTFNEWVDFINSTFNGVVNFSHSTFNERVSFSGSTFNGQVYFSGSTFNEWVSFSGSTFNEWVNFINSTFNGQVYFSGSTFNEWINFFNSTFKEAYFLENTFNKEADFSNTTFNHVKIYNSKFKMWVSFFNSTFNGEAEFSNTTFNKKADFGKCNFENTKFKSCTFEKDVDFKGSTHKNTIFEKNTFKDIAYFRNISYSKISFLDCTFKDLAIFSKKNKDNNSNNNDKDNNNNKDNNSNNNDKDNNNNKDNNSNNNDKDNNNDNDKDNNNDNNDDWAIFYNTQFLNKNSKITGFNLENTSFLMTDVKEIMVMCKIENKPILDDTLHLKYKDKDYNEVEKELGRGNKIFKEYVEHLKFPRQIIAEYRNLRKSIEENRTYEEASILHILEMEFRKKHSATFFEKLSLNVYKIISNYGESLSMSFLSIIIAIIYFYLVYWYYPNSIDNSYNIIKQFFSFGNCGVLETNTTNMTNENIVKDGYYTSLIILNILIGLIVFLSTFKNKIYKLLKEYKLIEIINLIRRYLSNFKDEIHETIIISFIFIMATIITIITIITINLQLLDILIKITSLILLGNLYIVLRRRLSRK